MDAENTIAPRLSPQQEDFLEVENQCCICGTDLTFAHELDATALILKEKAHCPCCKIQLKDKDFTIH